MSASSPDPGKFVIAMLGLLTIVLALVATYVGRELCDPTPSNSTGLEPEPTQVLPDLEISNALIEISTRLDDYEAIIDGLCEREDQHVKRIKALEADHWKLVAKTTEQQAQIEFHMGCLEEQQDLTERLITVIERMKAREAGSKGCKCESKCCQGKGQEASPLLPPQRRKTIHRTDGKQKAPVCHAAVNSVRTQCSYSSHTCPGGVCHGPSVNPLDTSLPSVLRPVRPEVALCDHPRLCVCNPVHGQGHCGPATEAWPQARRRALLRRLAGVVDGANVRLDSVAKGCCRQCGGR